jgi:hypothetical protein
VIQGPFFVQILDASFNDLGDSCLPLLESLQSLRVSHRKIHDGLSQSLTFFRHLEGGFERQQFRLAGHSTCQEEQPKRAGINYPEGPAVSSNIRVWWLYARGDKARKRQRQGN